jgi:phosphatidylglycerophosphate synthase
MTAEKAADRRPLASRSTGWAQGCLRLLLRTPISANGISALGLAAALAGGVALLLAPAHPWLFLLGAALTQFRLVCNLMDGLVAVEGGRGSPTGPLWNEVPDRLEDAFLLVGFGYAARLAEAGTAAAVLAVFTAYIRAVGLSHGLPQDFRGPMAKPQRMATLTAASVLGFLEAVTFGTFWAPWLAILLVALGTALTAWLRLKRIADALRARRA